MQSDSNILQVKNLSKSFGGLKAISDCSLKIKKGSITGIIGPNGSGKTTLFNLISGNLKSSKGTVLFNNEDITNIPSYELFTKGVLRTFQIAHEFTNLTVLENLMMVPGGQSGEKLVNALFKPSLVKKEEIKVKEKALKVIDFLNLKHLSNELAGNLSGGQKKLLELGRTMMVDAKLVLLDEVGAGVNRTLLKDIGYTDEEGLDETSIREIILRTIGGNPRSIKRLVNSVSLIQIFSDLKTNEDKENNINIDKEDEDLDEKDLKFLLFSLLCLQIAYPPIYSLLVNKPDFTSWDDNFAFNETKRSEESIDTFKEEFDNACKTEDFNEEWEKCLYRICYERPRLKPRVADISKFFSYICK